MKLYPINKTNPVKEGAKMLKPIKSLQVFYNEKLVGTLALRSDNLCAFEYDTEWQQHGFSISPIILPLKPGVFTSHWLPFDGLFGVFNDSLPDGWGRLLIDRLLRQHGINPDTLSPLDWLGIIGPQTMGALTYKPTHPIAQDNQDKNLIYLEQETQKVLRDEPTQELSLLATKGGSSGGARPKVLLTIDGEEWIIKFRNTQDPTNIGEIEYKYSQIAQKAGLIMPETRLFEGKYFGVKRFDRKNNQHIHMHTVAGLLNANFRIPSLDYKTLIEATLFLTHDIAEAEKMFRLMVFNVIGNNKDDHAKNFSFIYDKGRWFVSPAYDLVPSEGFNGQHTTTVLGQGLPTEQDMLELAKQTGLNHKHATQIIEQVKVAFEDIEKYS